MMEERDDAKYKLDEGWRAKLSSVPSHRHSEN
jgi:hypothetical protein